MPAGDLPSASQVKPIESIEILADKGYQGIKIIYSLSYTPIKKSKNKSLTSTEKEDNRHLAKQRIYISLFHQSGRGRMKKKA